MSLLPIDDKGGNCEKNIARFSKTHSLEPEPIGLRTARPEDMARICEEIRPGSYRFPRKHYRSVEPERLSARDVCGAL